MKKAFISLSFYFVSGMLFANNIQVSNLVLTGQNTTANTYQVQFDISWDNSWRTSTFESNYDAAWVFIKFKARTQTNWSHGNLNATGFIAPTGSTVEVAPAGVGAVIYRNANGIGNISFTGVQLQLNYSTIITDLDRVEAYVFAIEMVHVNTGAFTAGDGSLTGNQRQFSQGNTTTPFQITAESALTLGGTVSTNLGTRNNTSDDFSAVGTQALPALFPKGFTGFYCMKYEVTQGQYVDFVNTLPVANRVSRVHGANGTNGFTIVVTPGDIFTTTTPDRACNFLTWDDLCAYADWSGLRPMTELEYEKACRGTEGALPDEAAWGTDAGCGSVTVTGAGLPTEGVSGMCTLTGNYMSSFTSGAVGRPLRVGIFASSAVNKTREETGATYWGIMEMSGNVEEMVVGVGSALQRGYGGAHGNGALSATSDGNITGLNLFEYSRRGGGADGVIGLGPYRVSDRSRVNMTDGSAANAFRGGRLVRTTF